MSKTRNEISTINVESNVVKKTGTFRFRNGDEYNGQFSAFKDNLTIVTDGEGTYKTADGHIYNGVWENNTLASVYDVQYPDESIFYGQLDSMVIQRAGVYKFKEDIELEGNFVNNRVVGKCEIRDTNGRIWVGKGTQAEKDIFFQPDNVFWQSVLKIKDDEYEIYGEAEDDCADLVCEDILSYEK